MGKYLNKTYYISYVISILFILLVIAFIGFAFHSAYNENIEDREETIFKELKSQANIIDARMSEIIDRGKLQKLWIEELPEIDVESVDLSDYTWEYYDDLKVTSLVQTDKSYGAIFIKGSMDNLAETQIETIKRMLASFSVRNFMINHIEFSSWAIYYSDYDVISTYPYESAYTLFDPTGVSANETFEYIKNNIHMLREKGTEADYTIGWESHLNPDLNGNGIVYTRNWTIHDDETIAGIYQSAFNLEPLNGLFDMYYDNDYLRIVDPGNQLAYDKDHASTKIRKFDLFDINEPSNYIDNPYGEGLYSKEKNRLTYILPLHSTHWKIVYQIDLVFLSDSMGKILLFYVFCLILTVISGGLLIQYIHSVNVKKKIEDDKMIERTQVDYLTGVYNKKMLWKKLDEFIINSKEQQFSVAMLDIDDFKKVNDTYGHGFGDKVLVQVASTIKQSLRSNDIVCRFGGEEFALLLLDSSGEVCYDICNRILVNIKKETMACFGIAVSASMGLAVYSKEYSKEAILELADKSLYEAKNKGKDQVFTL